MFSKLQEPKNKIAVFISDIRLFEADGKRWQDKQGYQVINDVHQKHPSSLAYFVLTSKKGTITKRIQEGSDFLIHWYAKEDVISHNESFNIFFKSVRDAGDNCFYMNKSQPSSKPWSSGGKRFNLPLALYYKHHFEDINYKTEVGIINKIALDFINDKNREEIRDEIAFTGSTSEKRVSKDGLKKFRQIILTTRRIVYGLAMQNKTSKQIFEILKPNSKPDPSALRQLFNSTLATALDPGKDICSLSQIIEGKDLDNSFLEEEIEFLHDNFKSPLKVRDNRINDDDLYQIENCIIKLKDILASKKIKVPDIFQSLTDKFGPNGKLNVKEIDAIFKILLITSEECNLRKQFYEVIKTMVNEDLSNAKIKSTISKHFKERT